MAIQHLEQRRRWSAGLLTALLTVSVMGAANSTGASNPSDPLAGDARLAQKVRLESRHEALTDLLERLSKDTGVKVTAGPEVDDLRVTAFVAARPMDQVLSRMAVLLGVSLRSTEVDGVRVYTLYKSEANKQAEARERGAGWTRFRDGIRTVIQARKNPRFVASDPISRAAHSIASYAGWSVDMAAALPESAIETAFRSGEFRVGYSEMPPALRGAFVTYVGSQQRFQRALDADSAAAQAAKRKPAAPPTPELKSPLDRLSLRVTISGVGESAMLNMRIHDSGKPQGGTGFSPWHSVSLEDRLAMPRHFGSRDYGLARPVTLRLPAYGYGNGFRRDDVLAAFAKLNQVDVMMEAVQAFGSTCPLWVWELPEGTTPDVALDRLCMPFELTWNAESPLILFRQRCWANDRERQIPPRMERAWREIAKLKGEYTLAEMAEMASMNQGQQELLLPYVGQQAGWAVERNGPLLRFFAGLREEHRATAASGELGIDQLSLSQKQQLVELGARLRPGPVDIPGSVRGVQTREDPKTTYAQINIVYRDRDRRAFGLNCEAKPAKDPWLGQW